MEYYLCNFVDPSVGIDAEFLDPLNRSLSFTWKNYRHRLLQVTSPHRFVFSLTGFQHDWFSRFILFLESTGYEILDQDAAPFASTKKTCSARQSASLPPPSLSNSFEALSSMSLDVPLPASPVAPSVATPAMDFKSRVPPITLRLTDAVLPAVRPLLHKDSRLVYRSSKVTVRASSLEEYKSVLSAAAANRLEFYTHNPVVSHVSKSVLRGLPVDTSCDDILEGLSAQGLVVSGIRQMWRPVTDASGVRSRHLMPLWVLTHHVDVKPSLRALTGLLHFRVFVEALKSKDSASQCFRCQEFGHHAAFCKFPAKCNICAESHDSRQCPSRSLPSRNVPTVLVPTLLLPKIVQPGFVLWPLFAALPLALVLPQCLRLFRLCLLLLLPLRLSLLLPSWTCFGFFLRPRSLPSSLSFRIFSVCFSLLLI